MSVVHKRWRGLPTLLLLTALHGAGAQGVRADSVSVPDKELFHRSDLLVAAGFAGATVAMFPLDQHFAKVFQKEDYQGSNDLKRVASAFRFFGGPGPVIIGGGMYLAGRLSHVRRMAELGLHGSEAVLVGSATTTILKGVLGRQRPYVSADTNPRVFKWFGGFNGGDFASFPSGHTTAAFSAAAAVVAETSEWWPKSTKYIAPVMYGGATFVGISRMYDNKHWASDVVMGAAIGTFAGLKTVRFNHTHTGNRLDEWLLGNDNKLIVFPTAGGISVSWSRNLE